MTKKKKIIIISIVAAVLIIAGVVVGLMLKTVSDYKKKLESIQITDIDISSLSDGIYTGEYDVGLIYVKAEVTVVSGEITKIVLLKHENGQGEAAESIVDTIIAEQSLDVAAITGATGSSKTILKAVEVALLSEPKPLS